MPIALEQIIQACLDAAALLPRQGPITKFAFLNPLQGLEHVHFDKVMQYVGALYGNEAYLDDKRYREKLKRHRIVEGDLREVLAEELGALADERVAGLARRDRAARFYAGRPLTHDARDAIHFTDQIILARKD